MGASLCLLVVSRTFCDSGDQLYFAKCVVVVLCDTVVIFYRLLLVGCVDQQELFGSAQLFDCCFPLQCTGFIRKLFLIY